MERKATTRALVRVGKRSLRRLKIERFFSKSPPCLKRWLSVIWVKLSAMNGIYVKDRVTTSEALYGRRYQRRASITSVMAVVANNKVQVYVMPMNRPPSLAACRAPSCVMRVKDPMVIRL
jgi:hypothetical protein